jgi:hypothetical protein
MPVDRKSAGKPVWVVTVAPGAPLEQVKDGLSGAGFTVVQVLDAIGIVIAHGSEKQAEQARLVGGVIDVSLEVQVDIGPPDADVS